MPQLLSISANPGAGVNAALPDEWSALTTLQELDLALPLTGTLPASWG